MTAALAKSSAVSPRGGEHQEALDWVRGLASIEGTTVYKDTLPGHIRVPIFFALSRLLPHRPPADPRKYLVRRALRILPAYWLVVFVAPIAFHQTHRFLFFLQNYDAYPRWQLLGPRVVVEAMCWFALGMAICVIGVAGSAADGRPRRVRQVLGNRWWWLVAAVAYATAGHYLIDRPALRLRFLFDRAPTPKQAKPAVESPPA
jgi:peptidoglycan/LPS O-acetylase OafA/YrhL